LVLARLAWPPGPGMRGDRLDAQAAGRAAVAGGIERRHIDARHRRQGSQSLGPRRRSPVAWTASMKAGQQQAPPSRASTSKKGRERPGLAVSTGPANETRGGSRSPRSLPPERGCADARENRAAPGHQAPSSTTARNRSQWRWPDRPGRVNNAATSDHPGWQGCPDPNLVAQGWDPTV